MDPALDEQQFGSVTVLYGDRRGKYPHGNTLIVRGRDQSLAIDPSLGLVARGPAPPRVDRVLHSHCHEDHFAGSFLYPDDVEVLLVGEDSAPVTCAKGMKVVAHTTWDEVGDVNVLVYPGGRGTRIQLGDEHIRSRLRGMKERGTLMTSVCTGALVYADAGLLDGQPATTYWSAFDELLPLGREITPRPDDRFIDVGDVITAAGVSAGIDMALHLVGRLGSPDLKISRRGLPRNARFVRFGRLAPRRRMRRQVAVALAVEPTLCARSKDRLRYRGR